jgi:hypothetical protein
VAGTRLAPDLWVGTRHNFDEPLSSRSYERDTHWEVHIIEVDLKFTDFMDDKPLPGADVSLVFEVVPFFKKFIPVTGPGGEIIHPPIREAVVPDFSRAKPRQNFRYLYGLLS